MKRSFIVKFNGGRQWIGVYIYANARNFSRVNHCIAYYQVASDRKIRSGHFGDIYFGRIDAELVAHELAHCWLDFIQSRTAGINDENEERLVEVFGNLSKNFWRSYNLWYNTHKCPK
jgi:hypothetical protein